MFDTNFFNGEMTAHYTKNTIPLADPAFEKKIRLTVMPNPFAQSFSIRFNLDAPSDVIVKNV